MLLATGLAAAALPGGGSSATGAPARTSRAGDCHKGAPAMIHDGFPEPPTRYSRNGVLDTTLRASLGKVPINGRRVTALSYDGSFPGPTLVICAGDTLHVHLQNDTTEPTNLHTHGFHVSPEANHDNVFLHIDPHESFDYEYNIPRDMPAGSYWYHPHLHMFVEPHGMMAAVQVVREPTAAEMRRSVVYDGGLAISSGAYGSSASPPSVRSLLFFCRALGIASAHWRT